MPPERRERMPRHPLLVAGFQRRANDPVHDHGRADRTTPRSSRALSTSRSMRTQSIGASCTGQLAS
jgi:hypothetical protein